MRTIKLFIVGMLVLFLIQACSDKIEIAPIKQEINAIDTLTIGCLGSYDINPSNKTEKINQVYGKGHIKNGHWITFGLTFTENSNNNTHRIKVEEGYYKRNKKVGFWKLFNEDGTIKDSLEYKSDVPLTK